MDRIEWEDFFIKIASLTSQRSTCVRKKVGAVLVKDNRIISIGYNGSLANQMHCHDHFYEKYKDNLKFLDSKEFYDEHGEFSKLKESHAELNCILFAAKIGISVDGCDLYITDSPCSTCARSIVFVGIKKVFYLYEYDRDKNGIEILKENNVQCIQLKQNF